MTEADVAPETWYNLNVPETMDQVRHVGFEFSQRTVTTSIFWDMTLCTPSVLLSACLTVAPCLVYSFHPEHGGGVFSEMSVGFNWKTEPISV